VNISNIKGIATVNGAISNIQLSELQGKLHIQLPDAYVQMLNSANGFSLQSGVTIYSSDELVERNETFEVKKYAPGYFSIGDDSGGRSIMIPLTSNGVFLVDQGSMVPDDFERISISITDWITGGCAL
jgi:hypothetical protein